MSINNNKNERKTKGQEKTNKSFIELKKSRWDGDGDGDEAAYLKANGRKAWKAIKPI